jgi:hypothetical protein
MTDPMSQRRNEKAHETTPANSEERRTLWANRLEHSLAIACEAEAQRDYCRAARAFVIALLCEGRARLDIRDPWEHVFRAMPVY